MKKFLSVLFAVVFMAVAFAGAAQAESFKVAFTQDKAGDGKKYKPLFDYLTSKGVQAEFAAAQDYNAAARMFEKGEVDAMFSGSGIAGAFIIKGIGTPLVRPVGSDGNSTYWAVIIAPKGAPAFTGNADYFNGKKVITTSLASSGEFFFKSLPGASKSTATLLKAASHGAAIDALSRGQADFAIVKNRVWDKEKSKFPNLVKVGEDKGGENPDGTLMVSTKANKATADKVASILLAIEADSSQGARDAKEALGFKGFIPTTEKDFEHNLGMLKDAGVTKGFTF